jgi:hypothetical protein
MGAPSPELCNRGLRVRSTPGTSKRQHGGTTTACGAEAIRETMGAYTGMKPHMDVVTYHTTIAGGTSQRPARNG